MDRVCAWCNNIIESVSDITSNPISHGICLNCMYELEYEEFPIEKFIENIDYPVIVLNSKIQIISINHQATKILDTKDLEFYRKGPGHLIRCTYADLPGGCGKSIHCSGCTLRKILEFTEQKGISRYRSTAFHVLRDKDGNRKMHEITITCEKLRDKVLLRIDDIQQIEEKISFEEKKITMKV